LEQRKLIRTAAIPVMQEAGLEGLWFEDNPGKNSKKLFRKINCLWWNIPIIPVIGMCSKEDLGLRPALTVRPCLKNCLGHGSSGKVLGY
jgi:hypothetical protein